MDIDEQLKKCEILSMLFEAFTDFFDKNATSYKSINKELFFVSSLAGYKFLFFDESRLHLDVLNKINSDKKYSEKLLKHISEWVLHIYPKDFEGHTLTYVDTSFDEGIFSIKL